MSENVILIPGRVKSMVKDGHAIWSEDVYDSGFQKTQSAFNQELLDIYEALTQTEVIPVASADWPLSEPQAHIIYRVGGDGSYTDYMYSSNDLEHPVQLATFDNVGNISELEAAVASLNAAVLLIRDRISSYGQTQEDGFYVADSNGNVGMKYDANGLNAAKINTALLTLLGSELNISSISQSVASIASDILKLNMKVSDLGKTSDSGFYITDTSGNVVLKFDNAGFDVASLSNHFISLIPNAKSEIKILAIGNSYTVDAYTFLPYICKALDVDLTLYFTFVGGSSLADNWNNLDNETIVTTYRYEHGAWLNSTGRKISTLISLYEWDYVVLQQVSTSSTDSTAVQPYLGNFVDYITNVNPSISIGWLNTPAYGIANGYNDQQRNQMHLDMWSLIKSKILGSGVTVVVPEGTAIENARSSDTLKVLGTVGQLNRDSIHLDFGIGRYVAALAVYMQLVYPYTRKSVLNCPFWPVWNENVNVAGDENSPARENQLTSVTKAQALIAQKCAVASYMRQDGICDLSDF